MSRAGIEYFLTRNEVKSEDKTVRLTIDGETRTRTNNSMAVVGTEHMDLYCLWPGPGW